MKPQEIFDKVLRHLEDQGGRAVDEAGYCMYRAPDGRACALGALVDDETAEKWDAYGSENTGRSPGAHTLISAGLTPDWVRRNASLVGDLQRLHDVATYWDGQYFHLNRARTIAKYHGLSTDIIETIAEERRENPAGL
tara:strand:- start:5923 stop:6336 length:414 start_codon:yes stop_codon:yes gene_type:complete